MKKLLRILLLCTFAIGIHTATTLPATAQGQHGNHRQVAGPKTYRNVRGQVVAIVQPQKAGSKLALTLDHEAIPNFMRAMRMTLPLKNPADAAKLKTGTKIQFDLLLQNGNFLVANIKTLPPQTKLKLAAH